MNAITRTEFDFSGQTSKYVGKVRDVYFIADKYLVMVATDRISAFDVVLPKAFPTKGRCLTRLPRLSSTGLPTSFKIGK